MNDNLISRQAAIQWVKTECNPYGKPTLDFESGKRVMKHLEQMPPAQPKSRTGEWTLGFDNRYMEKYYFCSCCGCRKYGEHEPLDYFCSNCGADMRGKTIGKVD